MDDKIKEMLFAMLADSTVVGSWGVSDIHIGQDVLSFCVDGFRYRGPVEIRADGEAYDVSLAGVCFNGLSTGEAVLTVDREVEADDNYLRDVAKWLHHNGKPHISPRSDRSTK